MDSKNKEKEAIDAFLLNQNKSNSEACTTEECRIKSDKSLIERINKKIITEDGRQLLF